MREPLRAWARPLALAAALLLGAVVGRFVSLWPVVLFAVALVWALRPEDALAVVERAQLHLWDAEEWPT